MEGGCYNESKSLSNNVSGRVGWRRGLIFLFGQCVIVEQLGNLGEGPGPHPPYNWCPFYDTQTAVEVFVELYNCSATYFISFKKHRQSLSLLLHYLFKTFPLIKGCCHGYLSRHTH